MYHRVAPASADPLDMRVAPERFAEQVQRLGELADVVPLTEIRDRGSSRRVAITFDDGYLDNLTVAGPVLSEAGMPATLFVTRDESEPDRHFWWDRVEHLVLDEPADIDFLELEVGDRHLRVDVRTAAGWERAAAALNRRLVRMSAAEIDHLVAQLDEQTGGVEWPCDVHARLGDDHLRQLPGAGFAIGGHTRTHRMLSTLSRSEQYDEVRGCRDALENVVGAPVTTFAYPFGGGDAYTSQTVRAVRDAGYELACTTDVACTRPRTHRYRVPRLPVYDWDGDKFAARLEQLFELGV